VRVLSTEARAQLIANRWPGNVRELENAMHRAVLIAPSDAIGPESIIAPDGARLEEQRAAPAVAHAAFAAETVTRALVGRTVARDPDIAQLVIVQHRQRLALARALDPGCEQNPRGCSRMDAFPPSAPGRVGSRQIEIEYRHEGPPLVC